MADIAESIPLLSADVAKIDDGEHNAVIATIRHVSDFKGVSSNQANFDIVLDDMPYYQAVQPPPPPPPNQQPAIAPSAYTGSLNHGHGTSVQYPQASSINQQQVVIANQVMMFSSIACKLSQILFCLSCTNSLNAIVSVLLNFFLFPIKHQRKVYLVTDVWLASYERCSK